MNLFKRYAMSPNHTISELGVEANSLIVKKEQVEEQH